MPQWELGLAPNTGANAMLAFERGQEMKKQEQAQNALAAYATNPNPDTLNALAPHDPRMVIAEKQRQAQQQAAEQEKQLVGAALNGDKQARQQLAYVNSEMYLKLDEGHKKAVDGLMKNIGQTAFQILQLPETQQSAALDQALQGLQAQGIDTSSFQRTGNARQDLMTALAITGQLDDFEKFAQPKYEPVGEGGLVGFQFGQPIQQGGQAQNFAPPIQPGHMEDGYRFKGGNPADPNAWEKVGGPTPPASGTFQPVGVPGEKITSTRRSPAHNKAVGGVANSFHLSGRARDSVPPPGMSMAEYHRRLQAANPHLQVINEGDHVHMEPR